MRIFIYSLHISMAWQIPGIDSPCIPDVGDINAPVGQKSTFLKAPSKNRFSIKEQSTEALQPQPDPPA